MDSNEPGHAIPFITFVAKKGFVLTKEAEEFLTSLTESHIGVISVVGKYRTGKSFFINRVLLDTKKNGFNVGPTINPCTKVFLPSSFYSLFRVYGYGVKHSSQQIQSMRI